MDIYRSVYFSEAYHYSMQWRNVAIWCPLLIFCRPHKFFTVSKTKTKKKQKKGRHFFFGFSYRLLAPCSFLYPQIFFSRRPNAKLADIWYILLLCQKIFRLKNCKFGNMSPPQGAALLHSRGSRGGRYATDSMVRHQFALRKFYNISLPARV